LSESNDAYILKVNRYEMSKINNGRTCRNEDLQAIGITTVIIPYSSRLEGAIANPGCRLSNDTVAYFDTRPGLGVAITFAAFCRGHLNDLTLDFGKIYGRSYTGPEGRWIMVVRRQCI